MKKIILSALLVLAATIGVQAQTQKTSVSVASAQSAAKAAEIKFDTLSHDFGIFSEKDPIVQCTFTFTNVGTAPLIIHQAIASCGCTVPTYTKDPIKPGEKGSIDEQVPGQVPQDYHRKNQRQGVRRGAPEHRGHDGGS